MVTKTELVSLFIEFGIRTRHQIIVPDLIENMKKIPDYQFRDVISELINVDKIGYEVRSKGSEHVLKYINTFASEIFLSYLILAINQIVYKIEKSKEQTLTA